MVSKSPSAKDPKGGKPTAVLLPVWEVAGAEKTEVNAIHKLAVDATLAKREQSTLHLWGPGDSCNFEEGDDEVAEE
jgi:hypothetical protein